MRDSIAVIPGPREARSPESRETGSLCVSGFRVPAFGRPRNDGGEIGANLLA
jgi:hypothetical protein